MRPTLMAVLPALLIACAGNAAQAQPAASGTKPFTETIAADFESPWAMTFLPDGRALVTEKDGRMLLLAIATDRRPGSVTATLPVAGIPTTDHAGQGALMDVVLAPGFSNDRLVYFSGSVVGQGGKGVALWRGKLVEDARGPRLEGVTELFRATEFVEGNGHYSGRIAFSPDGQYLFFTNGERQKFTPAQDPKLSLGKVLRLTLDGKPAPGNPLAVNGFAPEIWSYGHRNLLGIAFDAQGNLWEQEMGPKGGDEINLIRAGANYGWPNASNGSNYDGSDIPDHKAGDGYEPPKVWWNPSISPASLMIYSGSLFPDWKGDIFVGGLSSQALLRVDVDGTAAKKGDQWEMGARIREVEQGPDGAIWLLEDGGKSQGRLIRLTPRR